MNHNKPIVKVLQYMYGDFEYFRWSEMINRRYCERHGYNYIISRETPRTDRHVCWHKVPVVNNALHNCDYLLYVDADAHFYSHELTIELELISLMRDKDILMGQDFASENERWTPGFPNSGVILVRNNERTHEFFKAWNTASDIDESTRWNWPPEQLALWNVVMPKFTNILHVHPEYYMIQGRYGHYIRHYVYQSDAERTEKMKQFCQSRKWIKVKP